jgi:hypothetical protein
MRTSIFLIALSIALGVFGAACDDSSSGGSNNTPDADLPDANTDDGDTNEPDATASGDECATPPATAGESAGVCPTPAGSWSKLSWQEGADTYFEFCSEAENTIPASQEEYDADLGTYTSGNDFEATDTCVSGSRISPDETTYFYLWVKR